MASSSGGGGAPQDGVTNKNSRSATEEEEQQIRRRDWAWLPDPALFSISMSLTGSLADVLAFGRVCRAWRSVAKAHESELMSSLPPLLFRVRDTKFHCPADGKLYSNSHLTAFLEREGSAKVVGCSFGHIIVTNTAEGGAFSVVNPLTGAVACRFHNWHLSHPPIWVVLSSPPSSHDCVLWACAGFYLEYCRLGDEKWSRVNVNLNVPVGVPVWVTEPVVFLGGKVYANLAGKLLAFDFNPCTGSAGQPVLVSPQPGRLMGHLCASGAELFLICVVGGRCPDEVWGYSVIKFDFSTGRKSVVHDLGDRVLFVDASGATLLENPGRWGGRRNCIYIAYVDQLAMNTVIADERQFACHQIKKYENLSKWNEEIEKRGQ